MIGVSVFPDAVGVAFIDEKTASTRLRRRYVKRLLGWGLVVLSFLFLWTWAVSGIYLLGTLMMGGQIASVEGAPSAGIIWSTVAGVALLGLGMLILSKRNNRVSSF